MIFTQNFTLNKLQHCGKNCTEKHSQLLCNKACNFPHHDPFEHHAVDAAAHNSGRPYEHTTGKPRVRREACAANDARELIAAAATIFNFPGHAQWNGRFALHLFGELLFAETLRK